MKERDHIGKINSGQLPKLSIESKIFNSARNERFSAVPPCQYLKVKQ